MKLFALVFCLSATFLHATVITSGARTAEGFLGNGRTGSSVSFSISILDSARETYAYTFSAPAGERLDWVILSLSDNCFAASGALADTGCAAEFAGNIAGLEYGSFSPSLLLGACDCATDLAGIRGVKVNFSTTAATQSFSFTSDRDVNYLGNFYARRQSGAWFVNSGGGGSLDAAAHLPTPDGGLISSAAVAAPEPSSALLLAIPMTAFVLMRRRTVRS